MDFFEVLFLIGYAVIFVFSTIRWNRKRVIRFLLPIYSLVFGVVLAFKWHGTPYDEYKFFRSVFGSFLAGWLGWLVIWLDYKLNRHGNDVGSGRDG